MKTVYAFCARLRDISGLFGLDITSMKVMTCIQVRAVLFRGSLAQRMRSGLILITPGMGLIVNCADQRCFSVMLVSTDDVCWMYPWVRGQLLFSRA